MLDSWSGNEARRKLLALRGRYPILKAGTYAIERPIERHFVPLNPKESLGDISARVHDHGGSGGGL